LTRVRILLADDHPAILERLTQLLLPEYEIVQEVRDGKALVEAAAATDPDVMIVDVSMPVMNGIEAAAQITRRGGKGRIIFLSVHEDPDFVSAALAAGGSGYVSKSRMTGDLRKAIQQALKGKRFVSSSAASSE